MQRTPEQANENFANANGDTSLIPEGIYCYNPGSVSNAFNGLPVIRIKLCPYWAIIPHALSQQNGYCAYLKSGDNEEKGTMHLWDQVKECGINDDLDEDYDDIVPWQKALEQ